MNLTEQQFIELAESIDDGSNEQMFVDPDGWLRDLYKALKASPASASVAAPDYRIADRGFRWDAENRQHIPQLLIEFAPVPANDPNDSKGWKDRDSLAAMLAAAPTPPVSEDQKDADRLNYLQEHGATVHLVSTTNSNLLSFVIGGLHRSKRLNLREAIDAAMQEDKP